jgi:hypothetical protein
MEIATMDKKRVKEILIDVLRKIQDAAGYAPVEFADNMRPIDDLEGFDSKVWPVSITQLCRELGIEIPKRTRLYEDASGRPLTISEIVDRLLEILKLQPVRA